MSATDNSSKGTTHWKKLTVQEMQGAMEVGVSKPTQTLSMSETLPEPQDDSEEEPGVESREFTGNGLETLDTEKDVSISSPTKENAAKHSAPAASSTVKAISHVQQAGEPGCDLEKRQKRAERFGVAVQMSEEEKRKARAARFGGSSYGSLGEGSSGIEEEKKRKARAERFGLPASSALGEEAKKKARLERFGGDIKCDSIEMEKREARAARFGVKLDSSDSDVKKTVDTNASEAVALAGNSYQERLYLSYLGNRTINIL